MSRSAFSCPTGLAAELQHAHHQGGESEKGPTRPSSPTSVDPMGTISLHSMLNAPHTWFHYSYLSASIGSARAARRAGNQHARAATAINNTDVVPKVSGSVG